MKRAAALGTIYLVWGSTYLAISVADRTLPPLLMLSVRFLIAGLLLYGWSVWRGDVRAERPGRRQWGAAAVIGGLLLVVDTGGIALAEQRVPTGYAALLVASVPLFMALLDRFVHGIRLPLGAVAGIATGLVGVALLVGPGGRVDVDRHDRDPRRRARLGRRLGLRARRAAADEACARRRDAAALRRGDARPSPAPRPASSPASTSARSRRPRPPRCSTSSSSARSSPSPRTAGS